MRTDLVLGPLLVVVASLSGCPGELVDPDRFADGGTPPGACTDAPKTVFAKRCVTACHSAKDSAASASLDLESPGLFARLQDKKARGGAGLLVDSSAVDKSVLLTKLKTPPPFGTQMPLRGSPLAAADIACVRSWITTQLSLPTDAGVFDSGLDDARDGEDAPAADAKGD